ncbi:MAG: TlpA family protein disulfide reductase [Parcubacteria group bacterium]|nr:TlpA family protein disulfide reductase [Parcubacteria group bacterium]
MKKTIILSSLIIVGILIALVFGVGRSSQQVPPSPTTESGEREKTAVSLKEVPDLSFKDYSGGTTSLAELVGMPLVINSWASWCPFCVDELPDFAEVQKEFGDRVRIIAVNRAEPLSVAQQYSDNLKVTDDLLFLLDPNDSFYRSIGGFSMPETIFVDGDGNIREHKRGPLTVDEMRTKIETLLAAS